MIFFSFVSLKKHFLKKMSGQVSLKKSSFWGANLNLHRGKTVKVFYTFPSLHDNHGQDLSNKKNQSSLSCLCPEICCGKNTIFFKKRVILWAPTVSVENFVDIIPILLRRDRDDARRWYRCVSRWSIDCRATACFEIASNVITQLSCNHNHSPPIFTASVRLLVIVGWTSYLGHYPWVTVFGVTLVFYIFV
jgi:hypothetical protein